MARRLRWELGMRELMRTGSSVLFVAWMAFSLVGGCCIGAVPFVAAADGGVSASPPPAPVIAPPQLEAVPAPAPPVVVAPAGQVIATRLSEVGWRALERAPVAQAPGHCAF